MQERMLPLVLLLNRLALGWYFAAVGWRKAAGELREGFGTFLREDSFGGRTPEWLPEIVTTVYGFALPWLELLLGTLLILGLFGRTVAALTTLLLLSIAIALLGTGELFPVHHAGVFLGLALLLWTLGPGRYSLDSVIWKRVQE